mmetsp:Transcript_1810/g.8016  ORF Transcript_1810/g.8016 Transcript_1810/m.8016 type:complete len:205 (-) Transcript_1810:198-812(-)
MAASCSRISLSLASSCSRSSSSTRALFLAGQSSSSGSLPFSMKSTTSSAVLDASSESSSSAGDKPRASVMAMSSGFDELRGTSCTWYATAFSTFSAFLYDLSLEEKRTTSDDAFETFDPFRAPFEPPLSRAPTDATALSTSRQSPPEPRTCEPVFAMEPVFSFLLDLRGTVRPFSRFSPVGGGGGGGVPPGESPISYAPPISPK